MKYFYFISLLASNCSAGLSYYVNTFAGTMKKGFGDGSLSNAEFISPNSISMDSESTMYIADMGAHTIRRIKDNHVTTIAGMPGLPGLENGFATVSRLNMPTDIVVDPLGRLIIADSNI
jgi:sugar lactone lactonase YvrE